MRKYLNYEKHKVGLVVGAMVMSVMFGCVFARGAGAISYSINYIENVASSMPENELSGLAGAGASATTLSPTSPAWAGHRFLGWCDQATTKSGDTDTCATGHDHQPGGTLTLDATGANNVKLYAMWEPEVTIATATNMQDVTSCPATLTTGQVYTIKDSRDNQDYKVAKLADGKCWLLDNLALDLTNSTVLSGMTQDNTNASNTTLGYLKGTTTGTTSDQYATAGVSTWTSSYSYSAPLVNMTNKDVIPTDATSTAGGYKVGGYYNYCAATAGSYCYGNGTSYGTSSGNATEDICPKGWRMPGGSSTVNLTATPPTGEYWNLYNNSSYDTYANYRSALRLPLSGYFFDGSASLQGSGGRWWSSSGRYDNYSMYVLSANTSSINPANYYSRDYGFSVRCVLGS